MTQYTFEVTDIAEVADLSQWHSTEPFRARLVAQDGEPVVGGYEAYADHPLLAIADLCNDITDAEYEAM